jgi:hypothetical protein
MSFKAGYPFDSFTNPLPDYPRQETAVPKQPEGNGSFGSTTMLWWQRIGCAPTITQRNNILKPPYSAGLFLRP